ncbi:alpha/beta fold hydrolase [Kribbella sp. CWNU-51]
MSNPNHYGPLAGDSYGIDDDRAPLLLLHGLTYDRRQWGPVLDELRRIDDRRRVLAVDLPGHGDSPPFASYSADDVVGAIHRAVVEARISSPIVVGHSLGGALATTYAGQYPVRGVVNVDQPLLVGGFGDFLRGAESKLHSPDYLEVWESLLPRLRIDLLPPAAQDLVRTATTPRQDILLGYWHELILMSAEDLRDRRMHDLDAIRANGTAYHHVSGDELSPEYRLWLETALPQVTITVLPGSGHFPHLAHPAEFANLLTA